MKLHWAMILRWYLWILMAGLLLQGLGSLIFRLAPALPASSPLLVRGAFGIDAWHALIHIIWGFVGVIVLSVSRTERPLISLALIFGLFYTALGLWGVAAHHPLGLELDLPENAFHLVAGPLSLLLGWLSLAHPGRERPRAAL
jgi:hypothetical protein